MHRSLKLLRVVEGESNLKSSSRIFRLFVSSSYWYFLGSFFLLSIAFVLLKVGYEWSVEMKRVDWMLLSFLSVFFFPALISGVWLLKNAMSSPLLSWLFQPGGFEFVQGNATDVRYIPGTGDRRSKGKMQVTLVSDAPSGSVIFSAEFEPSIWMFAKKEEDQQLKKSDDWYDLKGKRPYLPFPVHILQSNRKPTFLALVGIPSKAVDPAIEILRKQNEEESRATWRLFLYMILAMVGIVLVRLYLHLN